MKAAAKPITSLCRFDDKQMFIRERDVCDLIGNVGFTDVIFLDLIGRMPSEIEKRIIDGVLISLIEHGLSPSAIATRMTYASAPESLQGAVCAGLAGVGSVIVGSLENCAGLIGAVADAKDLEATARRIAREYKESGQPIPGFGHSHFKPHDPRTWRLFQIAEEAGTPGRHIAAAKLLSKAVDEVYGKHLTLNASAGMAAVLCEIGFPAEIMRGLAVICRSAGLVAHVYEEIRTPTAGAIWSAANRAVPYEASE